MEQRNLFLLAISLLKGIFCSIYELLFVPQFRSVLFFRMKYRVTSMLSIHTIQHARHRGKLCVILQIIIDLTVLLNEIDFGKNVYGR